MPWALCGEAAHRPRLRGEAGQRRVERPGLAHRLAAAPAARRRAAGCPRLGEMYWGPRTLIGPAWLPALLYVANAETPGEFFFPRFRPTLSRRVSGLVNVPAKVFGLVFSRPKLAVQRLGRQPNCSSQNKPPDSGFRHRGGRWPELHRPVLRGHGPVLGDLGLVQGRQGGLRRVLRPGVRPRKRLLGPPGGGCPPEGREWNRGVGCWPAASVGGGRGAAMRFRPEFAVGG